MNNNIDEVLLHDEYNSYKMNPDKRKKNTLNNNRCITECQFAGRTIYHPYNSVKIRDLFVQQKDGTIPKYKK